MHKRYVLTASHEYLVLRQSPSDHLPGTSVERVARHNLDLVEHF
jgi:hypothetical protein